MTRFHSFATIAAILAASVTSAGPDPVPADTRDQSGAFLRALDDLDVVSVDGEKIGEIEEVLVDMEGQPAAFVVEIGGFLGIGDRDAQVPIDAFVFENGAYVSKMTKEQLENLPEWDD